LNIGAGRGEVFKKFETEQIPKPTRTRPEMNVVFVQSGPINLHCSAFHPMDKTSVAAVEPASYSTSMNEG
jgi:hypothetical protein